MFKKLFLSVATVAAFAIHASAQDIIRIEDEVDIVFVDELQSTYVYKPYTFSIGPKVGVNYSVVGNPEGLDLGLSGSAGFSGGLAANLRFARPAGRPFGTERAGVQLEALYATHCLSSDYGSIDLMCYEIPVLVQWYLIPTLAVEVGPTFTGAFSGSPKEFSVNNTVYQMDKVKAADMMLSLGVNYKTRSGFNASLRYNLGNSDIAGNFQTKISTISFGFGWLFTVIK